MKLADVLAPYKHFGVASADENQEILSFFKSMVMETDSLGLRYERGEDFFAFLKEQCERAYIFTMKNDEGKIMGLGSMALIRHFVAGEEQLCAYLGDLRISPLLNAKIRLKWKKCYGDIISHFHELEEFKGVRYLYSAILDDNMHAMRSLLKNNDRIIYQPLTPYETVNIYGSYPLKVNKHAPMSLTRASLTKTRAFLANNAQIPGLQYFFRPTGPDELTRRLETWQNFKAQDFITVLDKNNHIIATCAPWMCQTKKLVVTKISLFYRLLGKVIFPLMGIPALKVGGEIKTLYLTNLVFKANLTPEERTAALTLMIQQILKKSERDFHLISFFDFPQNKLGSLPFFAQRTKATLYQVMSSQQYAAQDFLDLQDRPPAFGLEVA